MKKKILILAKSRKYNNFCVAGIDIETNRFIRLITEDEAIHHAVRPDNIKFFNGEEAKVLDIVEVVCKRYNPNYYQKENWIIHTKYFIKKIDKISISDIEKYVKLSKRYNIFYNNKSCVSEEIINNVENRFRYSLTVIKPEYTKFAIYSYKESNGEIHKKVYAHFKYKKEWYNRIAVTDDDAADFILNKHKDDGRYDYNYNMYFCISLGEPWYKTSMHYKLIAAIIPPLDSFK